MKARILTDVYFIIHSDEFENEAVPLYEMDEAGIGIFQAGSFHGYLYIEEGEEGTYNFETEEFESENGSTTRCRKEYIERIAG
jgi:hypothetical protein